MTTTDDAARTDDGAVLVDLVRALDVGDYRRAADRTDDGTADDLAEMWAELTDTFGSLDDVGEPTVEGREATLPLELGGQAFVASARLDDGRVEEFRITLSDDASTLSMLAGRLRTALSGLVDPFVDREGARSEAADCLATAQDPAERARAAVDLLAAERYDELVAVLDPPDGEDPETAAMAIERTWTSKVPSYSGVVRTAARGDSGYAFVDGGDGRVRVEVVVEDGRVRGLLFTRREDVASMVASRIFRGERFADLPEMIGDVDDPDQVASSAERAWSDLVAEHGGVDSVGDPSLDGEDVAIVDIETADASVAVRVAFDDCWALSALRLFGPDGTVAWAWESGSGG